MKVSTTGDIGDVVYLLGILSRLPDGPHDLCLRQSPATKAKGPEGVQRLYDAIAPLAVAQQYIRSVTVIEPSDKVDWCSEDFRKLGHYTKGETLMQAHLNHLTYTLGVKVQCGESAWLTVTPSPRSKGRVVINRTGRYRNILFPWNQIVTHYRNRLMFVGYVEHVPTDSMLDVAQLIAGSDLFIGNQSCAYAVAEGMKHDTIQETSLIFPDCIYGRPNAQYAADGKVRLPDGTLLAAQVPVTMNVSRVPPGSWQFPDASRAPDFDVIVRRVAKTTKKPLETVAPEVYAYNVQRCPEFFDTRNPPGERQIETPPNIISTYEDSHPRVRFGQTPVACTR